MYNNPNLIIIKNMNNQFYSNVSQFDYLVALCERRNDTLCELKRCRLHQEDKLYFANAKFRM